MDHHHASDPFESDDPRRPDTPNTRSDRTVTLEDYSPNRNPTGPGRIRTCDQTIMSRLL